MYAGKYNKKKRFHKRNLMLLVSLVLIFALGVGGTIAWVMDNTQNVKNTFTPSFVPNEVTEQFDGTAKNDVKIKNTSENVTAYIRAAVVANWVEVDGNGNPTGNIHSSVPVKGNDYNWVNGSNKWTYCQADGYYYYSGRVAAGNSTDILFTECKLVSGVTPPDGYVLSVEILGQSIQADGKNSNGQTPVELAWGRNAAVLVGAVTAN